MKKYFSGINFGILLSALIMGGCLFTFWSGVVSAETVTTNQETESGDALLQKQAEIDEYVFETHMEDLEKKGLTVTHTGPQNDYVEIGVTPYTDANVNYLYEIFGRDIVKIVEGQQAVTLGNGEVFGDSANSVTTSNLSDSPDKSESSNMSLLSYIIVGLGLLGVIVIMTRKLRVRNG
jgi:hypothetical protein